MTVSAFSLAVTVTGTFIGAGFVSGQELWQFFGCWGAWGLLGFAVAITLLTALSALTLNFVSKSNAEGLDTIIFHSPNKVKKSFADAYELIFYICIYVIMTAGVESILKDYFNVPRLLTGIVFAVSVSVISLVGIGGIVRFFSAVVPLLTLIALVIALLTTLKSGIVFEKSTVKSTVISNWFISALVYVSYNFFAGVGVLASVGHLVKSKKKLALSWLLSTLMLLMLGVSIITSVFSASAENGEMPMLEVAKGIHPLLGAVYSIFLILAMFGASISSLFPVVEWFKHKISARSIKLFIFTAVVSFITVIFSLFGFSELIGTVYPAFGYIGFILIFTMLLNFSKEKKC